VRPGTALCIDETLAETEHRYWEPGPARIDLSGISAAEATDELEARLSKAVALRLRADAPVGAYVSGGLDSAVIASLAKEGTGPSLATFGIGFDNPRFDETPEQRRVVDHLSTLHHEIRCDDGAIRDALAEVVWHCEMPLLRTSPVPLYLLSRAVRDAGMKTVLTGEGADELLAGYTLFKEDQIRRFWARQPESRLRPALLGRIHHYVGMDQARSTALWRSFFRQGLQDVGHPFYSHLIRWRNTAWTLRLLAPELRAGFDLDALMADAEQDMPAGWRDWDALTRAQIIEMRGFMSSFLLSCQGDRVAMAHGVEARYPFLDPELVDFSLALPKRQKLLGLRDKLVLRRLAARRLPSEIWARRKQPFRAPIGTALFAPRSSGVPGGSGSLCQTASMALGNQAGLIDAQAVGQLLARAQDGRMSGEREEMGLVGVLTLCLLAQAFGPEFPDRVRHARARLDRLPLHVQEDRTAGACARHGAALTSAAV